MIKPTPEQIDTAITKYSFQVTEAIVQLRNAQTEHELKRAMDVFSEICAFNYIQGFTDCWLVISKEQN